MREDLSAFFADWATDVARRDGTSFKAVVDASFVGVGEEAAVESAATSLLARSSDVRTLEHGELVTLDGEDYAVRGIEPDGTGVTTLRLERQ